MQCYAQGCSDAGFCSIVNHQNRSTVDSGQRITHTFGIYAGLGEGNTAIFGESYTLNLKINQQINWVNKINGQTVFGKLGTTVGFGDIISTVQVKKELKKLHTLVTAGVKVPLNTGNIRENNKALPMPYQTSLGSCDFIGGVTLRHNSWFVQHAWQIPIVQLNDNSYFMDSADSYKFGNKTEFFNSTNRFIRKPDALLRFGYLKTFGKWDINGNVLGIFHLGQDKFVTKRGLQQTISGSQGLTLNLNLIGTYKLKNKDELEFTFGVPLIVRKERPDGLTRALVLGLDYRF